jgi:hypothetical protein
MQTLIDPFELSFTKAYSRSGEQSGPRLIPAANGARATLLDVDEIAWFDTDDDNDDEDITGEVMLELDLEQMPRQQLPPRGRGARVGTSED